MTGTNSNHNHSIIYFLIAIMAVLLIVIVSSVYLIGSTLEELIIDYGEQTERTHADITNRLADLAKNNA